MNPFRESADPNSKIKIKRYFSLFTVIACLITSGIVGFCFGASFKSSKDKDNKVSTSTPCQDEAFAINNGTGHGYDHVHCSNFQHELLLNGSTILCRCKQPISESSTKLTAISQ